MGKSKSKNARASKIIAVSTIGVLIVAGLTLTFLAQEPANQSLVIKIYTLDGKQTAVGKVKEGGAGDELRATYTLNVENKDLAGARNVTMQHNWIENLTGWSVSFDRPRFTVAPNDIEQVEVTIQAPTGVVADQKTVVKIFAWEYLDIIEPPTEDKNTTEGVEGGEVIITTNVVPPERVEPPGPAPDETPRKDGLAGETVSFQGVVKNTGYNPQRFTLSAEVSMLTRAEIWPNAISFYPSDLSDLLEYNQEWPFRMDVKVPLDADAGTYLIEVTASGETTSSSFTYTIDVPEPDLFIDEIYFSHDSILIEQELTVYVKVGNKGSRVTDTFGVEVYAKAPGSDAWQVVGSDNITTGLKYGKTKTIDVKYKLDEEGIWVIQARVDPNNVIIEQDNGNNIAEKKIEAVKTEKVTYSFYANIIILTIGVGAVSVLSLKVRQKIKKK